MQLMQLILLRYAARKGLGLMIGKWNRFWLGSKPPRTTPTRFSSNDNAYPSLGIGGPCNPSKTFRSEQAQQMLMAEHETRGANQQSTARR